jgi:glutamate/tyrosine decarboxylase-like PLP-dependent enzyme
MVKVWKKHSQDEIKSVVFDALQKNINYTSEFALGLPASYLDEKVFNQDASFLKDAPYLSTLIQNPNHIGCHTLGQSESFFQGTQHIERELINICAIDILKGEEGGHDGYVASGGTEANLQAIWIYRNLFLKEYGAKPDEIAILCSGDSHYSMDKAANLLSLDIYKIQVDQDTREVTESSFRSTLETASNEQKKYYIIICNMMTTMFGSVDPILLFTDILKEKAYPFKIHVDGAYGGFYYPFSDENSPLNFQNQDISSFTLDAHKVAQAPYGTGIFLIRKGLIKYANTKEATYVAGTDLTLIGSRSGANAIATWMILVKSGPFGWHEKVFILQKRTEWFCKKLDQRSISYYRNPFSNVITMRSNFVKDEVASRFGLVPDNHEKPEWYKVVVMEHVTIEKLSLLLEQLI